MYLTIYVNDIIITCVNLEYVLEMKAKFCCKFDDRHGSIGAHFECSCDQIKEMHSAG